MMTHAKCFKCLLLSYSILYFSKHFSINSLSSKNPEKSVNKLSLSFSK